MGLNHVAYHGNKNCNDDWLNGYFQALTSAIEPVNVLPTNKLPLTAEVNEPILLKLTFEAEC